MPMRRFSGGSITPAPETTLPLEADLAGLHALEAGDAAQHRGLAAAAWPEQAADDAAGDREGHSAHHLVIAVGVSQVLDFEQLRRL